MLKLILISLLLDRNRDILFIAKTVTKSPKSNGDLAMNKVSITDQFMHAEEIQFTKNIS
jgi:hypothetical protein